MEQAFNHWSKIRITDSEVQRLIQIALGPNKETLNNIRDGRIDENSTVYKNQCYSVFGYAMMADAQQLETTKGTLFGAYNAITGYFQNVRNYKDDDEKSIPFCMAAQHKRKYRQHLTCAAHLQNMVQMLYSSIEFLNKQRLVKAVA